MIEIVFLLGLGLIWIIAATINDVKTREVPNWLNFSLIIFALGFRFFYSLFESVGNSFSLAGFNFFWQGLIGLAIFWILGNLLYYSRLFAGGDAKLMIALGPVLGISNSLRVNLQIYVLFLFLFLISGAIYGLIYSFYLGLRNYKKFKKEFVRQIKKHQNYVILVMFFGLFLIVLGFKQNFMFYFGILIFLIPYAYIYAKAVDEVCMVKNIPTSKLTEGDWLYKDVKIGKKSIKAKWEGVSNAEIDLIKKKFRKVWIRQGIPFVPVFLISFLILFYLYFFTKINLFSFLG